MGLYKSKLGITDGEIRDYQDLTYLSQKEILIAYKKFSELSPETVAESKQNALPSDLVMQLDELKENPFRDRICQVFSSTCDGNVSFEDFLDIMSVFSENAPKKVKIEYAFRMFDEDGDDMLNENDLRQLIRRLISPNELDENEMSKVVYYLLEECDLDDDKKLSFAEFLHVMTKAPDFLNSFRIRL